MSITSKKSLKTNADHAGAVIGLKTFKGEEVIAKVAPSFISLDQAKRNLKELGSDNFEQIKEKGKEKWNKELSRITIEGGTVAQYLKFYSNLYRSLLSSRKFYEYDENGDVVHYRPYNGKGVFLKG